MKFNSFGLVLCLGCLAKVTIQAPLHYQLEKRGGEYFSPVFTEPSRLNDLVDSVAEVRPDFSGLYGFDGGKDGKATVFPKAIPSAPWPYGRGLEPVWEGPNHWLDPNPQWDANWEKELKTSTPPTPTPNPKPVRGEGAWAPLGALGDTVDAMPVTVDSGICGEQCPTCGRKPSAWEKVVRWFKGAWEKVKGVFKKKKKVEEE